MAPAYALPPLHILDQFPPPVVYPFCALPGVKDTSYAWRHCRRHVSQWGDRVRDADNAFYVEGVAREGSRVKYHQETGEGEEMWDHRSDRESEVHPPLE